MDTRTLILFVILTVGFALNLIFFILQLQNRKRKRNVLVKIPLTAFILYNVCYVYYILFGIIKIL